MQRWMIIMATGLTVVLIAQYGQLVLLGLGETCRQIGLWLARLSLVVAKRLADPRERENAIKEAEATIEKAERGELAG